MANSLSISPLILMRKESAVRSVAVAWTLKVVLWCLFLEVEGELRFLTWPIKPTVVGGANTVVKFHWGGQRCMWRGGDCSVC